MNLFDRFILTIYSLALIVVSFFVIGVLARLIDSSFVYASVENLYTGQINIPFLAVAAIFLLISLRFFFSAFFVKRTREEKGIYQRNEYGMVNISYSTTRTVAERAARRIKGVRDINTTIKATETTNTILLKITVDGETPIPDLTLDLQKEVKQEVETIVGIDVSEVTVIVSEVISKENVPVVARTRRLE